MGSRHPRRYPARSPPPNTGFPRRARGDRKSTRLNSSHLVISYAVFCLKKKTRAPLGEVAVAGSRAALHRGRLEGVLGASGARPGAALRDVAVAGGGPALHAARLEAIGRAEGARPGAALGDVAIAGRRPAFGARR